jgi:predicted nucleotidyltransferase
MFNQESLNQYIREYIDACKMLGIHFTKVILFGSYARNTPHRWSDVDLALVSDDFTSDKIENRKKISKANVKFVDIEPHTYSTKYFENSDPFIEVIKKTGIEINIETK